MRLEIDAKVIISCVAGVDLKYMKEDMALAAENFLNSHQAFLADLTYLELFPNHYTVGVRVHFDSFSYKETIADKT